MPPAGYGVGAAVGGGGGKHDVQGQGGVGDYLDFKRSHEYNWNRLVWAHVSLPGVGVCGCIAV